jgi:hypothetical protein
MRIPFAVRQIDAMALRRKNQMLGHFDTVFVTDEAIFFDDGFFDVRTDDLVFSKRNVRGTDGRSFFDVRPRTTWFFDVPRFSNHHVLKPYY